MDTSEFNLLPLHTCIPSLCSEGLFFANESKNRYKDVIAPDATRVKINSPRGDYINANFVNIDSDTTVIACQGPTSKTESDFWTMILQYNVQAVLMLTPLIENGVNKCSKYWPAKDKTKNIGEIAISNSESFEEYPGIFVSTLVVKKPSLNKISLVHRVKHIYCTLWSDNSTPTYEHMQNILATISKYWVDQRSPFICHCSAGIGRTGMVISILRYCRTKENMKDVVTNIRTQRHGMVQNEKQFQFIVNFCNSFKVLV